MTTRIFTTVIRWTNDDNGSDTNDNTVICLTHTAAIGVCYTRDKSAGLIGELFPRCGRNSRNLLESIEPAVAPIKLSLFNYGS